MLGLEGPAFEQSFAAVHSWPFSEVRERLLNMLVAERVRFARPLSARSLDVRSWPFSEVRERLLKMLVAERVRFALYRRSLRGR